MSERKQHQWHISRDETWKRMIVRGLRRDPVVKRSNGTRDYNIHLADKIERGEIELTFKEKH